MDYLSDIPAIIDDIRFIHDELGFDMNQFNIMFAFDSALNRARKGDAVPDAGDASAATCLVRCAQGGLHGHGTGRRPAPQLVRRIQKAELLHQRFQLRRAFLPAAKRWLGVFLCARAGDREFHYGNVFTDRIEDILANGARKIERIHQAAYGFDENCQRCERLALCHTGCPVVKHQSRSGRSYTCDLQKAIYTDNPRSCPASPAGAQREDAAIHAWHAPESRL